MEYFDNLQTIAEQHHRNHQFQQALEVLQHLYQLDPQSKRTLFLLGSTLYSLGLYTQALAYLDLIESMDEQSFYLKSLVYQKLKNDDMSLYCLNQCTSWESQLQKAQLLVGKGHLKEAIQVYCDFENLLGKHIKPIVGDDYEQFQYFRTCFPLDRFGPERWRDLYYNKANLLSSINPLEAKMEYLKGLAALGMNLDYVYRTTGLPQLITPEQSHQIWFQHHHAYSHHTTSSLLQSIAKIYQEQGFLPMACKFYYLALSVYPNANCCNNIGILLAPHRIDESVRWYDFGLTIDPNHVHLCTNMGSALKDLGHLDKGIAYYQKAIALKPDFYIALANLANVFKDMGRIDEAIQLYKRALVVKSDFVEAFCNLVNSLLFICDWTNRQKNLEHINMIVTKQLHDAIKIPHTVPTVLPFHTFTYSLLTLTMVREICRRNASRVLYNVISSSWFPGFPKENQSNFPYPYPIPPPLPDNRIKIAYVSSDFTNHPLAHLMQSVFGFHNRQKFVIYCYALSPSDNSQYRQTIERSCDVFVDVSSWSIQQIVEHISYVEQIHILINLNGYTKGARNEIFAARPCPIQMSLMGYAGTLGAGAIYDPQFRVLGDLEPVDEGFQDTQDTEDIYFFQSLDKRWIDYLIADEIVCPQKFVCGEPVEDETECDELLRGPVRRNNDSNRIYTEALLYLPETYFCNDHRQGFREPLNPAIEHLLDQLDLSNDIHSAHYQLERHWNREQLMRMDMRKQLFPHLLPDTLILANFNQLYKIDPQIFDCWLSILRQIPNAVLWLLRFPPLGESHLKSRALKFGHDVANRVIFTDVAPKHIHIYRGRVADLFLDTPECNAHTTAADILWSGTPLITYPKYDFKMSSRVAASCAYSTGTWMPEDPMYSIGRMDHRLERLRDPNLLGHWMVAKSYNDYVSKAVFLLKSVQMQWKRLGTGTKPLQVPTTMDQCYHPSKDVLSHIYVQHGLLNDLRKRLFLNRDTSPLFDTPRYVKHLENGYQMAYEKWQRGFKAFKQGVRLSGYPTVSRCLKVPSIQY